MAYVASVVSRKTIKDFCIALGFAPEDVQRVQITPHEVQVTFLRRDGSGQIFTVDGPDGSRELATETKIISILVS